MFLFANSIWCCSFITSTVQSDLISDIKDNKGSRLLFMYPGATVHLNLLSQPEPGAVLTALTRRSTELAKR